MFQGDREGEFEPQLIPEGVRRFSGFDDKVISLYARGMTVSEIHSYLEEIYQTNISKDLISTVTDGVIEEVTTWQNRSLDDVYPILYLDCIHVKARDNHTVINKAVYLAIGVLSARYFSPPLRQMRSPLYTNFFVSYCHHPF